MRSSFEHAAIRPADSNSLSLAFRAWCYERAVHKHGWWSRGVTALYVANVAVLLTQATTTARAHDVYSQCTHSAF